eukprot:scaffold26287_cov214-Amphora_coffeaeformis.AAC.1
MQSTPAAVFPVITTRSESIEAIQLSGCSEGIGQSIWRRCRRCEFDKKTHRQPESIPTSCWRLRRASKGGARGVVRRSIRRLSSGTGRGLRHGRGSGRISRRRDGGTALRSVVSWVVGGARQWAVALAPEWEMARAPLSAVALGTARAHLLAREWEMAR